MQGTDSNYSTWTGRNPLFLLQTVTNQNEFYDPQHTCATPNGVGSLMTAYIACLLCQHRVQGGMYLWTSPPRDRMPFLVMPWTCLLLIRESRLVDSKGPPLPWGRAKFVGILGPVLLVLLLLLLLLLLIMMHIIC